MEYIDFWIGKGRFAIVLGDETEPDTQPLANVTQHKINAFVNKSSVTRRGQRLDQATIDNTK